MLKKRYLLFLCLISICYVCSSCGKQEEQTSSEMTPDKGRYSCSEIDDPINNLGKYLSFNSICDLDAYTLVTCAIDQKTGKNIYKKHLFQNGNWSEEDFLADVKDKTFTGFYKDRSSKNLYAVINAMSMTGIEDSGLPGENQETRFEFYKIEDGGKTKAYPVDQLESIDNLLWLGVKRDTYAIFYNTEYKKLYEYDIKEQLIHKEWSDANILSLCVEDDKMYSLNALDVTEITVFEEGAEETETIVLPEVEKALAIDVLEDEIFILTEKGIWVGNWDSENSFRKIFDGSGVTVDFNYLLDFRCVQEEDDYAFYICSTDENNAFKMNEIKRNK